MLKFSVLVFIVFAAISQKVHGWTDEEKKAVHEQMIPIIMECGEENGVTEDDMKNWKKDKKGADDINSCMLACIFKKAGMMDDSGMFSEEGTIEKSKKYLSDEEDIAKVKEAAATCKAVNDEDVTDGDKGCDRAKLIFACIMQEAEKFGIGE